MTIRQLFRVPRTFGGATPYHVGVELKTEARGEGHGGTRGAIAEAVTQVFRGRGGLIEYLHAATGQLRYGGGAVVPVIFTTAELITTETDLGLADVRTGDLTQLTDIQPRNWLWFDHHLSPDLRPHVGRPPASSSPEPKSELLRMALELDIARSVAVVKPEGIEDFLGTLAAHLSTPHVMLVTGSDAGNRSSSMAPRYIGSCNSGLPPVFRRPPHRPLQLQRTERLCG